MSSGERPIGAAKGKRPDTEALCQPPPPPLPVAIVGSNDIYNRDHLVGPFSVHKPSGPKPPLPPPLLTEALCRTPLLMLP